MECCEIVDKSKGFRLGQDGRGFTADKISLHLVLRDSPVEVLKKVNKIANSRLKVIHLKPQT